MKKVKCEVAGYDKLECRRCPHSNPHKETDDCKLRCNILPGPTSECKLVAEK